MTTRKYSSRSQQTTLTAALTSSATSATVVSGSGLLGGITISAGEKFTVVIDPDTALEEIVDVTAVSTNTLTIERAIDGSSGQAHSAGAVVRHMAIGRDYREANTHIENTTTAHGLTVANVVETTDTGTVSTGMIADSAVTSAKIADGTIVNADINASAAIAYSKLSLTGAILSSDIVNDTIVNADINTAAAIAPSKIAGTAVTQADTGTVTSTMIVDGTIVDADINASAAIARTKVANPTADVSNGGFKLTNLGTPTVSTDASTKAYVDTSISNLIDGAPSTLDTLNEIAAALADTANFSDTVVLKSGSTMSGALAMGTNKITGLGDPTNAQDAATKNYIDTVTVAPGNLTGPITSVGSATSIASQTGTGSTFVMNTSPTITTPVINTITAGASNTAAVLWSGINGGSISIGSGVTSGSLSLGGSNSLSGAVNIANGGGTTSRTVNIATGTTSGTTTVNIGSTSGATSNVTISGTPVPASKTLVVTTDKLNVHAATTSSELAGVISDETGSGALVFGTSPTLTGPVVISPEERVTVSATAAATTVNFDAATQGVLYYTSDATANWTLNVRGASGTTLNSMLSVGDSITVSFLVTNGSTAYYQTAFNIDGSAVTPKYSGGTAPASGNASAIDAYTYTIVKTAATPTYTVFGAGPVKYA